MQIVIARGLVVREALAEDWTSGTPDVRETVDVVWTDETASSRYGIGTIQIGDQDHGPADLVPHDTLGRTVAQYLCDSYAWGNQYGREGFVTAEQIAILRRFCAQWPQGPQFTPENW